MKNEKGFTLIELLVVVAIIGILAAIAIPQFAEYRQRAFDSRAQSDLRNTMTAQEAYFADQEEYADAVAALPGFSAVSAGVTLTFTGGAADWTGSTYHASGTKTYCYDSDGSSSGITTITGTGGTCT